MSAKGELDTQTGKVTLYETDKNGNYVLDINGDKISIGSMVVADNTLANGQSDTFAVTMGGIGASGQNRESNVFSTINDVITALNANDVDALHDLIDVLQADIDRLLNARADVGARSQKLDMLSERYEDDIVSYTEIYESQVGMDTDTMVKAILNCTAAQTAYSASLQVAATYLQASLLDYL